MAITKLCGSQDESSYSLHGVAFEMDSGIAGVGFMDFALVQEPPTWKRGIK
jgi:hypothetical protein